MASPAANRSATLERVAIDCSLGSDAFKTRSFRYTESLGQPFMGVLEATSKNAAIDFGQLLGKPLTVTATLPGGGQQHRSGLVRRVLQTGFERDLAVYELEIVPWIACLELGSDCRIFQNKSVVDILKKVFDDLGFSDYDVGGLVGNYQPLDFCVQYNETHFNFVHRLMQRAGIYYFHRHEAGSHTLVLADSHTSHGPFPGYAKISYRPAKQAALKEEHIFLWTAGEQMTTGKYTVKDYNFMNPTAKLLSTRTASHAYPHGDLERFEYPGGYATQAASDTVATARIEQSECREREFAGEAHCLGLSAGFTFGLEGQPRSDQNQSYLTEAIEFTISADEPAESGQAAPTTGYSHRCRFRAIPASAQFRPPRTAATPRIDGVQTAVVVAPAGYDPRTPYTDSVASARVQFRWDRAGSDDEKSSCWVRCSQPSAGNGWGSLFLPLAGNEVVVAFLDGDPDRPIIVGNVYNAANLPPRPLPDDPFKTVVQDVAGNFIAFDSEEDSESFTIRTAYKDQFTMMGDCSEPD
jgi:type VI secretion system secreted protein VgrG